MTLWSPSSATAQLFRVHNGLQSKHFKQHTVVVELPRLPQTRRTRPRTRWATYLHHFGTSRSLPSGLSLLLSCGV